MFVAWQNKLRKPQKKRTARVSSRKLATQPSYLSSWAGLRSVGTGILTVRMVEQLFTRGKRAVRFPYRSSRFWVNIHCGLVLTQKPANVRMGKGKGAIRGRYARVYPGIWLLAVSLIRVSLLRYLRNFAGVRCGFKVMMHLPHQLVSSTQGLVDGQWARWGVLRQLQRQYLYKQKLEWIYLFYRLHQPVPLQLFHSIFRWRSRVAHARLVFGQSTGLSIRKLLRRKIPQVNPRFTFSLAKDLSRHRDQYVIRHQRLFQACWHRTSGMQLVWPELSINPLLNPLAVAMLVRTFSLISSFLYNFPGFIKIGPCSCWSHLYLDFCRSWWRCSFAEYRPLGYRYLSGHVEITLALHAFCTAR